MPEQIIRFKVVLREDTHTGTGVGLLGLVDDTQSRDPEGRPVIRPSTLRGLLRDAGEDWLFALEKAGAPTGGRIRLDQLLGKAGNEAGLAVATSLRLIQDAVVQADDTFLVWTSTAREVHRRQPEETTLRQVEHLKAGLTFEGEIRLGPAATPEGVALLKLLTRCLRRVVSLGAGKTRGWGQIELKEIKVHTPATHRAGEGAVTTRLRLQLQNLEPLNLAATAFAGNLVFAQSYVPGGRLRGALLAWLSDRDLALANRLADPDALRVGNAYFAPRTAIQGDLSKVAVLPAPLTLQEIKGSPAAKEQPASPLPWWARPQGTDDRLGSRGESDRLACPTHSGDPAGPAFKRIKTEDYLVRLEGKAHWHRVRPGMGVLMRNQVPGDRLQPEGEKRTDEDQGLFSEQVIWEGQGFVADLCFARPADAEEFRTATAALLEGPPEDRSWLRVGRGGRPVRVEKYVWLPPSKPDGDGPADCLTVTLTSDLIARTSWLTFHTDLGVGMVRDLVREAGGSDLPAEGLTHEAIGDPAEVYGFNGATGLPRCPALAVKRGSVLRLRASTDAGRANLRVWRQALAGLLDAGLGERRADGFGRFVLDLDLHDPAYWPPKLEEIAPPTPEAKVSRNEELLQRVLHFLDNEGNFAARGSEKDGPTVAQWQYLRGRARTAKTPEDLEAVLKELQDRAQLLAGRAKWQALPGRIAAAVRELPELESGRFFLDHLAQAAVARLRNRRRKEGGSS